jgi:hypothetical protein
MPVPNVTFPPDPAGQPQDPLPQPVPSTLPDSAGFLPPVQTWQDEEFPSQLPVAPYVRLPIPCAPIWGFETPFTVGDLQPRQAPGATPINSVAAATKSAAVSLGCQRYEISPFFSDPNGFCDLNIYRVDSTGDTLVKSFARITRYSKGLFVGGQDLIVIDGLPIKVEVLNFSAGLTMTVNVTGH